MKMFNRYLFVTVISCLFTLFGCSTENNSEPEEVYDREAMLTNYASNLIVPSYEDFKAKTDEMVSAMVAFTANPSGGTLTTTRQAYLEAYKAWQQVSIYEFGPADEQMLRNNLNIYPVAISDIESNIESGVYDLQAAANLDAKGFPALDYLLYSDPTEAEVIALFTSAPHAANRQKYLKDVAEQIQQRVTATYNGWTSGNYSKTFQEAAGTAVGSAVANLVNQLNYDIDLTKRAKVGIPSGRFTAGTPLPEKVEAYYSATSLSLLQEAVKAQKAMFLGQNSGGVNGPGLDDYLNHVDASYNGQTLTQAIVTQFDAALAAVNAVPVPLAEAVTANPQAVSKVYEEMQKLIVLTKTDMPAALGVSITYTDNDGD